MVHMQMCHANIWMSHGHVSCIDESCHTYEWVLITRMNESCPTYKWVMLHIQKSHTNTWTSHFTWKDEPCHMYRWAMSHIWMSHANIWMRHVTRIHRNIFRRAHVQTPIKCMHAPWFIHICVPWLIHIYVPWLIHTCVPWLIHICVPWFIHIYVPWVIHICVPWLIHIRVPWLIHVCVPCHRISLASSQIPTDYIFIWMSHGTHMNKSWHTWISHIT